MGKDDTIRIFSAVIIRKRKSKSKKNHTTTHTQIKAVSRNEYTAEQSQIRLSTCTNRFFLILLLGNIR